jgi:hypothetical protein
VLVLLGKIADAVGPAVDKYARYTVAVYLLHWYKSTNAAGQQRSCMPGEPTRDCLINLLYW